MTTAVLERDTTVTDEPVFDEPIPCDKLDPDDDCNNSADYKTQAKCCGFTLMLCESCLFAFIDWARFHSGRHCHCSHCHNNFILTPNHLIVTGRI